MNQYGMMNMNQMNMNQMDYALQHLPPHILQHVNATAIGARPPQKEPRERKDKNAPKRNWSAYQFYVEENRQGLRDANPDVSFGQISKIAAAQWRALPSESKRRYEIMAENDKLRYQEEMRHYVPPPGTRGYDSAGKKKKKAADAPKTPLSAYFMFPKHIRPTVVFERPDLNLPGITQEVARRWRMLTAEEKAPYEEQSTLDKQRYQMEIAAYKQQHSHPKYSNGGGIKQAPGGWS